MPILVYAFLTTVSLFLFFIAGYTAHHQMWISHASLFAALLLLLYVHHWFFHRILSEAMMDMILTTKRFIFIETNLFFRDDIHEVALERLRAVEAHKRGLLQNLLHYGSIWFDTGGSPISSSKLIPLVPHPHHRVHEITSMLQMK